MKYQTTNLQPTKRYPTYQFHARTAQKNCLRNRFSASVCWKPCIGSVPA